MTQLLTPTFPDYELIDSGDFEKLERFGLTDIQAQAIVEMTLGRLSGLERQKIMDRIAKLTVRKEDFKRTGTLKVSRN